MAACRAAADACAAAACSIEGCERDGSSTFCWPQGTAGEPGLESEDASGDVCTPDDTSGDVCTVLEDICAPRSVCTSLSSPEACSGLLGFLRRGSVCGGGAEVVAC